MFSHNSVPIIIKFSINKNAKLVTENPSEKLSSAVNIDSVGLEYVVLEGMKMLAIYSPLTNIVHEKMWYINSDGTAEEIKTDNLDAYLKKYTPFELKKLTGLLSTMIRDHCSGFK